MKKQQTCPECGRPVFGNRCPRCHRLVPVTPDERQAEITPQPAPPPVQAPVDNDDREPSATESTESSKKLSTMSFIEAQQKARRVIYNAEQSAREAAIKIRSEAEAKAENLVTEARAKAEQISQKAEKSAGELIEEASSVAEAKAAAIITDALKREHEKSLEIEKAIAAATALAQEKAKAIIDEGHQEADRILADVEHSLSQTDEKAKEIIAQARKTATDAIDEAHREARELVSEQKIIR